MTTVLDQIEETRGHLLGLHRAEYNRLGSSLSTNDTSVTLEFDSSQIGPGSIIAIDDELIYVWDAPSSGLTVQRAMLGSVAATHTGTALVEVNPRFPQFHIRRALRHEMLSWSPSLFQVETVSLSVAAQHGDVDYSAVVDPDYLAFLRVLVAPRTGRYDDVGVGFRVERATEKLYLDNVVSVDTDVTADVAYPIGRSNDFDDGTTLASLGLSQSMEDIAPLGAVWRLVAGREVRRNLSEGQGEPRDAAEVPAGAITQTARAMKALRDERIKEEAFTLRYKYPLRKHL